MRPKLFDLNDLKASAKEVKTKEAPRDHIAVESFLHAHEYKIESLKDLRGSLPSGSEIYFIFTVNSFNAFTIVPYLLKEYGKIEELILSSYSINSRILQSLIRLLESGKIEKIFILLSDSLKFRMPKVAEQLHALTSSGAFNLQVVYGWNHSKVTLAASQGNFYVFEGSGNWSENAALEQYVFLNSQSIYEFRKKCIQDESIRRAT